MDAETWAVSAAAKDILDRSPYMYCSYAIQLSHMEVHPPVHSVVPIGKRCAHRAIRELLTYGRSISAF